jgi:exonuclease SbcC
VRGQLAQIEDRLAREDYAAETQAELAAVRAELADLGYDEAAHREARGAVEAHQPFEARHAELQGALTDGPQVEATLADLEERAANWEITLAEDRERQAALAEEVATLEAGLAGAEQVERELERVRQEYADARVREGAAQQRLEALEQQKQRRERIQAELADLQEQRSIYDELRLAFSKNGIPAMIIDAAIPELQETANNLLARMTDGRMHVQLSTQREKVTGGVAETLDILISDGLSTRDYETFSGGEAMRINFALRIALSKLLARRAGAQLRTLVIDEGFGSQDAAGRERLMEAVNSVQDDFGLILVITHLDELKDRFPVRIEITKMPDGSQIEMV